LSTQHVKKRKKRKREKEREGREEEREKKERKKCVGAHHIEKVEPQENKLENLLLSTREDAVNKKERLRLVRESWFLGCSFVACGIGVALPWTALRTGVTYFKGRFSPDFYTRLFIIYYVCQAVVLFLQERFDARADVRYGVHNTYTFRIVCSLSLLSVFLLCLPLLSVYEGALNVLSAGIGSLDAICFGTSSQLFGSIENSTSGAYFLGSSLSSLLVVGISFASGFATLIYDPLLTAVPTPLVNFYISCAAFTLLALVCMLGLLCSKLGRRYLLRLDDSLLIELAPDTPRATARRPSQRSSPIERWGLGDSLNGDGSVGFPSSSSPSSDPPINSTWDIFKSTWVCQLSIAIIWAGTTASDSLIAFMPSQHSGSSSHMFSTYLLYASLAGELIGKNVMFLFGMKKKDTQVERQEVDLEGNQWSNSVLGRLGLDGSGFERGYTQTSYIPRISSLRSLLTFCVLRTLLLIPNFFFLLQQTFGPSRGGDAPRGWFYSDGLMIAMQAIFDASGAYLSSTVYAMLPTLVSLPYKPKASALLALSLTLGTFIGLALSLSVSSVLPNSTAG